MASLSSSFTSLRIDTSPAMSTSSVSTSSACSVQAPAITAQQLYEMEDQADRSPCSSSQCLKLAEWHKKLFLEKTHIHGYLFPHDERAFDLFLLALTCGYKPTFEELSSFFKGFSSCNNGHLLGQLSKEQLAVMAPRFEEVTFNDLTAFYDLSFTDTLSRLLATASNLRTLSLQGPASPDSRNSLTPDSVKALLKALASNKSLHHLELSNHRKLGYDGISELLQGLPSTITNITLSRCGANGRGQELVNSFTREHSSVTVRYM